MAPKLAGALEIGQSITKNRFGIDSIDTLRFWYRYVSIPEIRYFCQAWPGALNSFDEKIEYDP